MRMGSIGAGVLVVATVLGFATLCGLFWLNRADTKVWEYMAPAIGLGLLVPLVGTFAALQSQRASRTVPATLFFYNDTQRLVPLDLYYQSNTRLQTPPDIAVAPPLGEFRNYKEAEQAILRAEFGKLPTNEEPAASLDPKAGEEQLGSFERYLQIAFLGFLWDPNDVFGQSWVVRRQISHLPHSVMTSSTWEDVHQGHEVSWKELRDKLGDLPLFSNVKIPEKIPGSLSQTTVFPPGSRISFSAENSARAKMEIRNRIFTLIVEVQPKQVAPGFGKVGELLALPNSGNVTAFSFEIQSHVTYHWHHIGHPQTSASKAWVGEIINRIESLDIEERVENIKQWRSYR